VGISTGHHFKPKGPTVHIATKTLAAIDAAFHKDQGAKFRGLLGELMPLAGDAYSTKEDDWRDHLGASLIGRECSRELWYSFHWCTLTKFDGRMLRLFNRGHLEEPRFVAMLKMIGCEVWQVDANGKQFRISGHRGHFGGSMDAVVTGLPDLPEGVPALAEFKTHGEKSFLKLEAEGVMSAKWEHFIQMQVYMGKNELPYALYGAVSKNTDALHMEIIPFDPIHYQKYLDRSATIIDAVEPPKRISTSPGFFKCKFCDHIKLCHLTALPERNCRTCIHSRVIDDGKWYCSALLKDLTPAEQRAGCDQYDSNPAIYNSNPVIKP
jgi:hypothetical protein